MARRLLCVNRDAKTRKGTALGYLTGILYLAPNVVSGYQVCPMASPGCILSCLFTAGRGAMYSVRQGRINKTIRYFEDRAGFMADLVWSIGALIRQADRVGLIPCVRLNGTSDIRWERVHADLFDRWPGLQFYDYTKIPNRVTPANYHLTFSRSEDNETLALAELARGKNAAIVFNTKKDEPLPTEYKGFPVFSADKSDLRFLDPFGIAGLFAKGSAKKDRTGFVVKIPTPSF